VKEKREFEIRSFASSLAATLRGCPLSRIARSCSRVSPTAAPKSAWQRLGSPRSATPATTRRCINTCADLIEPGWIQPIYFITGCTKDRRAMLARDEATEILIEEWHAAHGRQ